jgi:aspartate/methionine/tyrosine aminotransferase
LYEGFAPHEQICKSVADEVWNISNISYANVLSAITFLLTDESTGTDKARQAIADYVTKRQGKSVLAAVRQLVPTLTMQDVVLTCGCSQALEHAMRAVCDPGDVRGTPSI